MGSNAYFRGFVEAVFTLSKHESIFLLDKLWTDEIDINWEDCNLLKQALKDISETELSSIKSPEIDNLGKMYVETRKSLIELFEYANAQEINIGSV
ncbi:hypothetical protein M595_1230 [Lyngbya aestuarii BL J]|uniref:Uncharacterized protein n=2 Tax=Lyngbya aestuarii TaxID=118322 RepID=U7QNA6_9CYAN|nr:hypothetical protein M595_1230 [Lyngbya aestuarii BL J]